MPSYINPKFVHVEPRRGVPIGAVIVLGVLGYACFRVAELIAEFAVAILAAAAVVTMAAVASLVLVLRRQRGRTHLDAHQWVVERPGAPRIQSHRPVPVRPAAAIPARSPRAIEAPSVVHYHLHLRGVSPDAIAALTGQLSKEQPAHRD
jgi:amino acid transporter